MASSPHLQVLSFLVRIFFPFLYLLLKKKNSLFKGIPDNGKPWTGCPISMPIFYFSLAIKPVPSPKTPFSDPATGTFQAGEARLKVFIKGQEWRGSRVINGALLLHKYPGTSDPHPPLTCLWHSRLCRAGQW